MTIYHGSKYIIEYPQPWLGRKNNDYGQGFYCTESEKLAREWAVAQNEDGFVNVYSVDFSGLKVLDLMSGEYNILNWLAILLENRTFKLDNDIARQAKEYILKNFGIVYDDADVITGYRADDSYFAFASAFLNNTLSLSGLEKAMVLGNLGEQIFLKSRRAFDRLEYRGAERVEAFEYYPLWLKRDIEAREMYCEMKTELGKETFILDIIRDNWENSDARLQRIIRI